MASDIAGLALAATITSSLGCTCAILAVGCKCLSIPRHGWIVALAFSLGLTGLLLVSVDIADQGTVLAGTPTPRQEVSIASLVLSIVALVSIPLLVVETPWERRARAEAVRQRILTWTRHRNLPVAVEIAMTDMPPNIFLADVPIDITNWPDKAGLAPPQPFDLYLSPEDDQSELLLLSPGEQGRVFNQEGRRW